MSEGVLVQVSRSNGGVPKMAVSEPVTMTPWGIEGDRQRDLRFHGGPDKAVLMIAAEVLDELVGRGFPVNAGAMGENLTVRGLDPAMWRSGQQYRVGNGAIQLTTLRVPCSNLFRYGRNIGEELYDAQCKAGNPASVRWARGGFYARVLQEGLISAGAEVALLSDQA